jgi:hypothetical protein
VTRLGQLLLALGEQLGLRAVPLDPERDPADIRADQGTSMSSPLEDGFALASFAGQLVAKSRP